tara:strand:+ start:97 stop:393 length:297 start_codon:yes stop_codon:yes gene_type:complete
MYYEQPAAEDKVLILRLDLKENESPLDENHPNQCKPPVLANQQLAEELQWKRGEGDTVPNKPIIQLLVKEPTESWNLMVNSRYTGSQDWNSQQLCNLT